MPQPCHGPRLPQWKSTCAYPRAFIAWGSPFGKNVVGPGVPKQHKAYCLFCFGKRYEGPGLIPIDALNRDPPATGVSFHWARTPADGLPGHRLPRPSFQIADWTTNQALEFKLGDNALSYTGSAETRASGPRSCLMLVWLLLKATVRRRRRDPGTGLEFRLRAAPKLSAFVGIPWPQMMCLNGAPLLDPIVDFRLQYFQHHQIHAKLVLHCDTFGLTSLGAGGLLDLNGTWSKPSVRNLIWRLLAVDAPHRLKWRCLMRCCRLRNGARISVDAQVCKIHFFFMRDEAPVRDPGLAALRYRRVLRYFQVIIHVVLTIYYLAG